LGHGDCNDVFVPQEIAFFSGMAVRAVACGDTHTLVVTQDGQLYTFGRNQNGQLGHGNIDDVLSPKLVEALQVTREWGLAGRGV
jgi:alpha-tubulin suppressor-like RCC1 family protein